MKRANRVGVARVVVGFAAAMFALVPAVASAESVEIIDATGESSGTVPAATAPVSTEPAPDVATTIAPPPVPTDAPLPTDPAEPRHAEPTLSTAVPLPIDPLPVHTAPMIDAASHGTASNGIASNGVVAPPPLVINGPATVSTTTTTTTVPSLVINGPATVSQPATSQPATGGQDFGLGTPPPDRDDVASTVDASLAMSMASLDDTPDPLDQVLPATGSDEITVSLVIAISLLAGGCALLALRGRRSDDVTAA